MCFDTPEALDLLRDEQVTWAHHPTTRNVVNLVRNLGLAWRVLRRERPDVVISTGAGVAVPFFVLARLTGISTTYLEVYDRIDTPTLTARLCRPFTDRMLVQWDEQRRLYAAPRSWGACCEPDRRQPGDRPPSVRAVGEWSEAWVQQFTDWQLVVQHGYTRTPAVGTGFDFCGREQLDELFERAQVVACHGGPGTITQAKRYGHTPIVVPRDPGQGEHVDDHQQLFSRRLGSFGSGGAGRDLRHLPGRGGGGLVPAAPA